MHGCVSSNINWHQIILFRYKIRLLQRDASMLKANVWVQVALSVTTSSSSSKLLTKLANN